MKALWRIPRYRFNLICNTWMVVACAMTFASAGWSMIAFALVSAGFVGGPPWFVGERRFHA